MKKEDLVAKGLSEEHAQIAVDAYGAAIKGYVPKSDYTDIKGQLKAAKDDLEAANGKVKTLEESQGDTEKLKTRVAELEGENDKLTKSHALKDALRGADCIDPDYIIYKHGGIEKFTFAADGKPAIDDVVKSYKGSSGHLFAQQGQKPGYTPASGSGTPPMSRGAELAKERNQKAAPAANDPWATK